MPTKSDVVRLRHMLDAAEKAINFTKGIRRAELDQDEKLALALVRLIEIIGEAAAKVSTELQTRSRTVSWKEIVGTRNRLIHGYEEVDFDIVWKIIEGDLPGLISELRILLKGEEGSE